MAFSKAFVASIFISLVVFQLVQAIEANSLASNSATTDTPVPKPVPKIDCGGSCKTRCFLSKRPNLCNRACGTCCARCNCVPEGTSGNYESCACYANMTTHGNQKKCP